MSQNQNARGRPTRGRYYARRGGQHPQERSRAHNNASVLESGNFESLGCLENSDASLNEMQNNSIIGSNRESHEENLFSICEEGSDPFKDEVTVGSSDQPPKRFHGSNDNGQDNQHSPDNTVHEARHLLANAISKVQNLDPSEVIEDCRKKITQKTECCITNHGKKISKILSQISKAGDKDKSILGKHLANMKSQLKSFQQFQQQIFGDLGELYFWSEIMEIIKKTGDILFKVDVECKQFAKNLPSYSLKNEIQGALTEGQVAIISCDAVYCGNTVIPLLIQDMFKSGIIASCELSDVLAWSSATKCASLTDQKLGQLIDYEVGKENVTNIGAKIIYTTVQDLFSNGLKDPLYSRYSCIVFNEFLHRSVETDILLASLCECMSKRNDLKLVFLVSVAETAFKMEKYFSEVVKVCLIRTEDLILPVQVIWKETTCNSEYDVCTETADMCLAIHVLNGMGDVVAFLPSKEEALNASVLTTSKLVGYSFTDAECIVISESSTSESSTREKILLLLEQKQHSQNIRSFIFTHGGFESLFFPSVHYVIDCGRTKEMCYDQKKKLEFQRTSFISRARAKIRRNCAGRSFSGVCYRVYSKENFVKNMVAEELPDLLTKSPLNSLAKMFKYKPAIALELKFVEPFPEQVKENAQKSLKSLGALKDGKLTVLGERITTLPFLPRYSKLIILGIQWGISLETVVVVALFLVQGYFFKYRNNEEFKKTVDLAKLKFSQSDTCQTDSDTFTFLNIYKQWTENKYRESWCDDNCIEFSFMEKVHAKVNEICEIIYKHTETSGLDKFSDAFKWSSLQELIFECFKDNLCVYTGHFSSGYRCLTAQCIVFLHPSTSVPVKENLPQFIVYDKFISKTHNFVTHITSVPEALVTTEALKDCPFEVTHHDLFERNLVPCVIDHVGGLIMRKLLKKEKVRDLEEQLKNATQSELIVIDPSMDKGNVTVFAVPDSIQKAEVEIRKILQENVESLRNEKQTLILELRKGNSIVPVGISWASGAKISSVISEEGNHNKKSQSVSFDSISMSHSEESAIHGCIKVSWMRRPCTGFGYIGFDRAEDFSKARKLGFKSIRVKGCEVLLRVKDEKNKQLHASGLHPETSDSDLKVAVESVLANEVCVTSVNVILSDPHETKLDDIRAIETQLKKLCQDLLKTLVEVEAKKPKKEDVIFTAEIKLWNDHNLSQHAATLNSKLKFGSVSVKAKPFYYSDLFCNIKVLKALEHRIQASLKTFESVLRRNSEAISDGELFRLEADTSDYLTAKLKLSAQSKKTVADLRKIIQDLLEGDIIKSSDVIGIHKLFCHGGHLWLENLQKSENVHIIDEDKTQTIRLYGSPKSCENAALRIKKFLNSAEEEVVKHRKNDRILLKAIIEEYGVDLNRFIDSSGLRSAELDIRKCQLTLHGSAESIEKAETELDMLAGRFDDILLSAHQTDQEICPVCLCPALTLTYRLENCGHLYCGACLKSLLNDVVIPLQCCAEDCGKDLILEDIRKVLDYDDDKIDGLLRKSLKDYLAKNRAFGYCPAPDCSMFVDKTKIKGSKWKCPLCRNAICIPCNSFDHPGMDCKMYQETKKDEDYSFKAWKQTADDCKICPSCGGAIQKNGGCLHMTCSYCQAHICWPCLKVFKKGSDVYDHLPFCPKNQGR